MTIIYSTVFDREGFTHLNINRNHFVVLIGKAVPN